jgi:NTP pyrophosphatase (non-canonical NTP hydrolase)
MTENIRELAELNEPGKSLAELTEEVARLNRANGWHDTERTFGDDVALLHSEVSEMFEAFRDHGTDDATERVTYQQITEGARIPKPEGVGSEAADVLIRLLDTCGRYGIDLLEEYERKMFYNRTRSYRHGGKRV